MLASKQQEGSLQMSEAMQNFMQLRTGEDFDIVPGSVTRIPKENGEYEVEFKSKDGTSVHQWFTAEGLLLEIESFDYGDKGVIHNWYQWGDDREIVIQYDRNKLRVQLVTIPMAN